MLLFEEELTQMALPEAAPEMVPEAELPVEKLPTLLTSKAALVARSSKVVAAHEPWCQYFAVVYPAVV